MNCPFCSISQDRIIERNEGGYVISDGFPISPGHTLVIPHRHFGSWFSATKSEHASLHDLLQQAHARLEDQFKPASFNIGINDGQAAGQTVPHMHIHLIPRYDGDRDDPRGGVRWIIPEKADYWSKQ